MIKGFLKDKFITSIISLTLVVSLLSLLFSFVFSPVRVSAAELSFTFPSSFYSSSVDHELMDSYLLSLKSNPSLSAFTSDNLAVAFFISGSNVYVLIMDPVVHGQQKKSKKKKEK